MPNYRTQFTLGERVRVMNTSRYDDVQLCVGHIRILSEGIVYGLAAVNGDSCYPLVSESDLESAESHVLAEGEKK